MDNAIIILALVLLVGLAILYLLRRRTSKGGCCAGGDYRHRRKHLHGIAQTRTFRLEGMHCKRCQDRVEEIVDDMPGIAGIADHRAGTLRIAYAREVADAEIAKRLERAGYVLGEEIET